MACYVTCKHGHDSPLAITSLGRLVALACATNPMATVVLPMLPHLGTGYESGFRNAFVRDRDGRVQLADLRFCVNLPEAVVAHDAGAGDATFACLKLYDAS